MEKGSFIDLIANNDSKFFRLIEEGKLSTDSEEEKQQTEENCTNLTRDYIDAKSDSLEEVRNDKGI